MSDKNNGSTRIEDLPSTDENIKLEVTDNNNIKLNDIFKNVQDIGVNGDLSLPSRDIPLDETKMSMDNISKPNYIPKNEDYITNIYETYEDMNENQRKKKNKQDSLEVLYDEMQTPLLLSVLYFIFQLPSFNNILSKYIKSIFKTDGNLNIYGLITKSVLFALSYYSLDKLLEYISI
jgi:hypothetical protein